MRVLWSPEAWDDYVYWQGTDAQVVVKINDLLKSVKRAPFSGIGHPERLGLNLSGWWSRRITREHRLVYRVVASGNEEVIEIMSCRHHYKD